MKSLAGPTDRLLVVTAHPDDEITMAGTLALAARAGARVTELCLTRGEASRAAVLDGEVGAERIGPARLATARERELRSSAGALGIADVRIGSWPDGRLTVSAPELADVVEAALTDVDATVVISLDDVIGLYGHPDHVASGAAARVAVDRTRAAGRSLRWYQATLPRWQVVVARRLSPVFRRAVTEAAGGPPVPTVYVPIVPAARQKLAAVRAHDSQRAVLGDVQPLFGTIPDGLYYHVFSREYFTAI